MLQRAPQQRFCSERAGVLACGADQAQGHGGRGVVKVRLRGVVDAALLAEFYEVVGSLATKVAQVLAELRCLIAFVRSKNLPLGRTMALFLISCFVERG